MIDQCAMKGHDGRTTLPTTTTTVLEIPSQDRPRYKSRFANYQGVLQKYVVKMRWVGGQKMSILIHLQSKNILHRGG
jgi:hypothetical protein